MIIKNGVPRISRDEVVLFSFDDHSIPKKVVKGW